MKRHRIFDCIIVGGGPAGLMAGIYLARFRCNMILVDADNSRANLIPLSHNFPGAIDGITGKNILSNLKKQYKKYGGEVFNDEITDIKQDGNMFLVKGKIITAKTKYIILATGVIDIEPDLPNLPSGIKQGLIRHCLICDGFEVINKRVAIIGKDEHAIKEAMLLKTYTDNITIFYIEKYVLSSYQYKLLDKLSVHCIPTPIDDIQQKNGLLTVISNNQQYHFDTMYSALGMIPRTELAIRLGARHTREKLILVNSYQQTSIKNFYAIGDIVSNLNQLCVAMGQAAVATTHIFNNL